jgi:hypothetical protein
MFSERFAITAGAAYGNAATPSCTFAEGPLYVDLVNDETDVAKVAFVSFDGVHDAIELIPTVYASHRFYCRGSISKVWVKGSGTPVVQVIGER